ncbi:MAG: response regulator transcription factor [Alistipes sp.]|mgnify:FL=1|nr:response regulator transcription factor [Rikenellaceae bacterium]MBO5276571.1 response regulator transcription factor [Alistipes sp.]MBO5330991.1 response regulator transcription factor [Alistipes sp.]MBP3601052.1 response regulator transcription factor [Alistipes sp.]
MVRIALVDDHSLFRRGLKMLLTSYSDFEVVAEASSGEEFLELMDAAQPDVVFMDYSMGGMNGAETTERALERMPELKVISLTMFGDNAYYSRMASSGAKGFLLKDSEFDEVVEAVSTVCDGGTYFSALLLESISQSLRSVEGLPIDEHDMLSDREVEILVGICQGLSTQEIADRLFISKRTVDKHRANILEKSGCKNTASLVVYAIKNGLVEV